MGVPETYIGETIIGRKYVIGYVTSGHKNILRYIHGIFGKSQVKLNKL